MQITNLTKIKINEDLLQTAADKAVAVLGPEGIENLSLVLVSDVKMKAINKKYRGHNLVTDVLSFEGLNEIFICLPQAKRQAGSNSPQPPLNLRGGVLPLFERGARGLDCELTRLLVHGIVHLKGYDHEKSAKEAERMFELERKILEKINSSLKKAV